MEPLPSTSAGRGRGRSRGRGRGDPTVATLPEGPQPSPSPSVDVESIADLSDAASVVSSQSSRGHARGRGRGQFVIDDFSSQPYNPEEDDFLQAFRKLKADKEKAAAESSGRINPSGSSLGHGSRPSPPSPSLPTDSGFVSRAASTKTFTLGRGRPGKPNFYTGNSDLELNIPLQGAAAAQVDSGSEDYSDLEDDTLVKRGENGKPVPIVCNFLKIAVEEDMGIFEYHVDFEPPVDNFRLKKQLIRKLERMIGTARIFDGSKLYLAIRLEDKVSRVTVCNPNMEKESFIITIKYVKRNRLIECVHFYNVMFRRIMDTLGYIEMKRCFYDHRAAYELPQHKLDIWPGYVTTIDEYEGGLFLCCDANYRVLQTQTVLDVWNNFLGSTSDFGKAKKLFHDYIIGKIVLTRYNNKYYRVDDIDWESTPQSDFARGTERVTYLHYYKVQYNIDIRTLDQPLLITRPREKRLCGTMNFGLRSERIGLIPEICHITGLDENITSNYHIMKDMAIHTKLPPHLRVLHLETLVKNINENEETKSMLGMWGLTLVDAFPPIEGRLLTMPQVMVQNYGFQPDKDFSHQIVTNRLFDPVPVRDWKLFYCRHERDKARRFLDLYRQVARYAGISVSFEDNDFINLGDCKISSIRDTLQRHVNPETKLAVVILSFQRDDLYGLVKKICTNTNGIPSQVILSRTLQNERKLKSITQKIMIQINCKLGGSPWMIRIPLPEKIMFVGMDVYHDAKMRSHSVTGVVASMDLQYTKYYSKAIFQSPHQETTDSLLPIIIDMLIAYRQRNGAYPDRVIFWRDGVSDGQFKLTKMHEIAQILGAFTKLEIRPKFTFCVVQKRINARLFLQDPHQLVNPAAGTVVDHTITRKQLYDFFLISQTVNQGTVTPTHYVVLEDNCDTPPDLIQKFAFANSMMYYNWAGSIRVPAMCQYAHKLAALVGQHLKAQPPRELEDRLFYL